MTPMTLFIPTVGTVLELVEDWTFPLHEESRNHKFSKEFRLGYREWVRTWGGDVERADLVTLPAGTRLKVDRIYIRKGGGARCEGIRFRDLLLQLSPEACPGEEAQAQEGALLGQAPRLQPDGSHHP